MGVHPLFNCMIAAIEASQVKNDFDLVRGLEDVKQRLLDDIKKAGHPLDPKQARRINDWINALSRCQDLIMDYDNERSSKEFLQDKKRRTAGEGATH